MIYYAIGTYTTIQPHVPKACGKGISILAFNSNDGILSEASVHTKIADPTYLNWDPENKKLYAITEDPNSNGVISSFTPDESQNIIAGEFITGPGKAGCHLKAYPDINRLYAAAYLDGVLEGCVLKNAEPAETVCRHVYSGNGPNAERQEASHAHQVLRSPDKKRLYVCDLGSDTVWMHSLNEEGNASEASAALKLPGGYGPRHIAFDPAAPFVYILCELIPRLVTARISPESGRMEIISDAATVKKPEGNPANPAAIKLHPSGETLAVSNRFQDTIGVFKIERAAGSGSVSAPQLSLIDEFYCRGKTPRDIEFSPDGRWLMIANQDSSNIECRNFNPATGLPSDKWGPGLKIGSPVCITLLEGLE